MKSVLEAMKTKEGYSQGTHKSKGTEVRDIRGGKPSFCTRLNTQGQKRNEAKQRDKLRPGMEGHVHHTKEHRFYSTQGSSWRGFSRGTT